jgi:hypothetical protein
MPTILKRSTASIRADSAGISGGGERTRGRRDIYVAEARRVAGEVLHVDARAHNGK